MRLEIRGEYPSNWREIADSVKSEAGNRCVRCGHPEGDWRGREFDEDYYGSGRGELEEPRLIVNHLVPCDSGCTHPRNGKLRALTVHHLDGDKSNCRWWNLLALCQACHLSVQARVIPERPWLWEHSAWFRPYVAGFYAFYHGELELTRAEVERDFERYLRMGQYWRAEAG